MNEIQFQAEKHYQTTMALARVMREKGLLTLEEYADFDTKMLEKYRPLLGGLCADTSLTI